MMDGQQRAGWLDICDSLRAEEGTRERHGIFKETVSQKEAPCQSPESLVYASFELELVLARPNNQHHSPAQRSFLLHH